MAPAATGSFSCPGGLRPQPTQGINSSGGRSAPGPGRLQHRLPLSSSPPALPSPPPAPGDTVTVSLLTVDTRRLRPGPGAHQEQQRQQPGGGGTSRGVPPAGGTCNTDRGVGPSDPRPAPPPALGGSSPGCARRSRIAAGDPSAAGPAVPGSPGRARSCPSARGPGGWEAARAAAGGISPRPGHKGRLCREPPPAGTSPRGAEMFFLVSAERENFSHVPRRTERRAHLRVQQPPGRVTSTRDRVSQARTCPLPSKTYRNPEFYFGKQRPDCSRRTAQPGNPQHAILTFAGTRRQFTSNMLKV